jgi:pilus assembly protein Flp/PilA
MRGSRASGPIVAVSIPTFSVTGDTMRLQASKLLSRVVREDDGATMVEYALLVALIAIIVIVAVQQLGTNASTTLQNAATYIAS